jgi:hypothetical protein
MICWAGATIFQARKRFYRFFAARFAEPALFADVDFADVDLTCVDAPRPVRVLAARFLAVFFVAARGTVRFFRPRVEAVPSVRPSSARRLLTVAAAMAFALFVPRPRSLALSFMCSYCRSSLADQAFGIRPPVVDPCSSHLAHQSLAILVASPGSRDAF